MITGQLIYIVLSKNEDVSTFSKMEKINEKYVIRNNPKEHKLLLFDENVLHLSILHKTDHNLIGHIILCNINAKSIEFRRIVIYRKHYGYGREAIQLLKDYCITVLKCQNIWLDVYKFNKRAIALYLSEDFYIQEEKSNLLIMVWKK